MVVAHNGVDLKEFQNRPSSGYLHRELGLPAGARLIVTIGQLGIRKGTDVALDAFGHITRELSDVPWLVGGTRTSEKPESIAFEAQLRTDAAIVSGRVHLLGQRDDVAAILNECHLLVHAAHQEPLGRVLLEAAACGLPVVATDVGGTREIFPDESAGGVLVAAGDAAALAAAVVALLNDDTRRGELGAGADRRAGAEFDARQATHRLCKIYAASLTNTAPD